MAQLRAQEIVTNRDVVSELIHKSFLERGVAEQRLIVHKIDPNRSFPFEAMEERFVNSGIRRSIGCVEVK